MRRSVAAIVVGVAFLALPASAAAADFQSTFDSGDEGWLIQQSLAPPEAPTFTATGGNPGGYISATDTSNVLDWQFTSPPSWGGDRTANLGGQLSFDMRHTAATVAPRVVLFDTSFDGVFRTVAGPPPGPSAWTHYAQPLNSSGAGWTYQQNGNPSPATAQNMADVLGSLYAVAIVGDLDPGMGGRGDLDNVRFLEPGSVDTDGDGIPNPSDKCPTQAGPASRDGCPIVRCAGLEVTKLGKPTGETIVGTPRRDVIAGLGGGDTIKGLGGGDIICGGEGGDIVLGGGGADEVHGGAGNDTANGGGGADELLGEAGSDILRGGAGPDNLKGGPGRDKLFGGPGRDRLNGGPGSDVQRQ